MIVESYFNVIFFFSSLLSLKMHGALLAGYAGSALTFTGMVFQIYHCAKRKSFRELSKCRMATGLATHVLNLTYGILSGNVPVCLSAVSVIGGTLVLLSCYARSDPPLPLLASSPSLSGGDGGRSVA